MGRARGLGVGGGEGCPVVGPLCERREEGMCVVL